MPDLPAGDYVLTFQATGYVSTSSPVVHIAGAAVRVSAELWPDAKLHGRVLDDNGLPVGEVPVELYRYRGGQPTSVKTDCDGRFSFPSVNPGVYGVAARPSGKAKTGPHWRPPGSRDLPIAPRPSALWRDRARRSPGSTSDCAAYRCGA